jgi:hypothetical protein
MRIHLFVTGAMLLPSVLMLSSVAALSVHAAERHAADQHVKAAQHRPTAGEPASAKSVPPGQAMDGMASGAVEDTLKACLSRIPADGTAGQRMLAEQGCQGQHETRTSNQAAPRF